MSKVLLDASALLAVLNQEKGCEIVEPLLRRAALSAVNYAEVISKLAEHGVPPQEAALAVGDLVGEILPFDAPLAVIAGRLRAETKALGLSLGDRACLATAESHGLEVITADKLWAKVKTGVKIRLIRS